jgi:tetratricopeptide (TPR) repeat protein
VETATVTRDPRLAAQATKQAVIAARYDTAIEMAQLWQELSPEDIDAHQTLGNLLVVRKKPEEASLHYSKAMSLTDSSKRDLLLTQISATLIRYASSEDAMTVIDRISADFPGLAAASIASARIASHFKDYAHASEVIDRALQLDPDNSDAAVIKFSLLILEKKTDEAETFAVDYLDKHPKETELRTSLARYYLENNELKKADREYTIIHRLDASSVIAPMALALIRIEEKDLDSASEYLERVLELQTNNDLARIYLGDIANRQERLDDAEQWYRAVTDEEQIFNARTRLVGVIRKRDGIEAALRELESIHPVSAVQQVELILTQNELLIEEDRLDDAQELLDKSLQETPDDIDLLYARAMIAARKEDVESLEKDLLRVLQIQPGHVQSLNALGFTLADLTDRYEEAYSLVNAAFKKKPNDPFILDSMGWVEYRLGNIKSAEDYLRRALELRNDPEIAAHLAEVLFVAGKKSEARRVWEKANDDFPDNKKLDKARIILEKGGVF